MAFNSVIKEMSIIPRVRSPTTPSKSRSPKRVFSTSKSRLLQALDAASNDSKDLSGPSPAVEAHTANEDPFGGVWPPRRQNRLIKLTADDSIQAAANPKLTLPVAFNKPVTAGLNLVASTSKQETGNLQVKPVSEGSKENATSVSPSTENKKSPPKALAKYSYKDFKPSPARVYVRHMEEADDLVGALSGPLGFDLEWRVIYRRGAPERPAATVQICNRRMILVIQVTAMKGFPKKLKEVLEDPKIPKMGVNILNDGIKLARDYGVRPRGLVELGGLARQADTGYVERYFAYAPRPKSPPVANAVSSTTTTTNGGSTGAIETPPAPKMRKPGFMISLATITAMYTARSLSKGPVRTSNWEAQPLSEAQLEYAANDAHCALMVYNILLDMAKNANITLDTARFTQNVRSFYGAKPNTDKPKPVPSEAGSAASTSSASPSTSAAVKPSSMSNDKEQSAGSKSRPPRPILPPGVVHQRPQHIRAYNLWYHKQTALPEMCASLRSADNPLKVGTVIGYVVGALQADPSLHFPHGRLTDLLKAEDASWNRHKEWYNNLDAAVYINMSKT